MKAEDLQIGDWILASGKPIRATLSSLLICDGVHFKPIPLTPEILEKNGWCLDEIDGSYRHYDNGFWIGGRNAPFGIVVSNFYKDINYVHELQHVLQLCGIEKGDCIMIEQNHEYHVSFGVAKLLKEAGFDWECRGYFDGIEFHPNGSVECTNYNSNTCKYLKSPTLDVAQRWLREFYKVHILIDCIAAKRWEITLQYFNGNDIKIEDNEFTYEQAQEAGIKKALEIILEKGK